MTLAATDVLECGSRIHFESDNVKRTIITKKKINHRDEFTARNESLSLTTEVWKYDGRIQ
jgi:hypothetical protein